MIIDWLLYYLLKVQTRLMNITAVALGRRLPGELPVHKPVKVDAETMQAYEEMVWRDHEASIKRKITASWSFLETREPPKLRWAMPNFDPMIYGFAQGRFGDELAKTWDGQCYRVYVVLPQ
jgi:hypothetical protein